MPESKVTALINFVAPFYPESAENPEWSIIFFCQQKFIKKYWLLPKILSSHELSDSVKFFSQKDLNIIVYGYHHLSTYRTYYSNLYYLHESVIWQSSARSHFLTIKILAWSISCISYMIWNAATILNMGDVLAPV